MSQEPPAPEQGDGFSLTRAIRSTRDWIVDIPDWFRRSHNSGMMILAILVGAAAGLGAIAFRYLIQYATLIFSGHADYAGTTGNPPNPWVPWLGPFFIVLAPAVGGLIYGPLVHRYAREARGHGVPEVMYAISKRGGRIPAKVAGVKALASAITIGSGGSVGREGPIVQIGASIGSTIARFIRLNERQVKTLVAAGAAGGIAATFNAPLAGIFFAMELLLLNFTVRAFAPVVLASVTASVVARSVLGDEAFLVLPEFHIDNVSEYALYAVLGLLAAAVATGFTKSLYAIEDLCDKAWKAMRGPEWLRPGVGGLLLGLLLLAIPQMYGVGYPVLENAVMGAYAIGFLVILLLAKILATSLTIGIGGSGGVFAPSLFLGAMLGAAFGQGLDLAFPSLGLDPGAYALVGMAAVFAGASRAPITAVIILFELTDEYSIILPLLLAVAISTVLSGRISKESIYSAKLMRRGIDLSKKIEAPALAGVRVRSLMRTDPPRIGTRATAREAVAALVKARRQALPVLTEHGEYVGVVTAAAAGAAIASDEDSGEVTVSQLIEWRDSVAPSDSIEDILEHMRSADVREGLPVLDGETLVGWLPPEAVLRQLSKPVA